VAATGASSPSFDHLDCSRNPRRDETMRCAVASRRGSWNDRRDLVAVLESLPGAVRLDDEHSVSGGICSGSGRTSADACAIVSADAIGFIVSVAAASRSVRRDRHVDQIDVAQEAQYRCPGSTVVWVNEHSSYHFRGTRDYGDTKPGAYMREADAQASGNRAAKNERHP